MPITVLTRHVIPSPNGSVHRHFPRPHPRPIPLLRRKLHPRRRPVPIGDPRRNLTSPTSASQTLKFGIIFGASLTGGFLLSAAVMLTSRVISTRTWAIANMLITAAAGIVLILADDFWLLAIGGLFGAYAASGAHWGGMMQLEQTGIAAVIPQENRTKAYSILTISSSAGRAGGALLAGLSTLLITTLEWNPTDAYHALLWIYVALHIFASLVYLFLSSSTSPSFRRGPRGGPSASADASEAQPFFVNPFKARKRRPILTMSSLFALDSFAGGMVFESFVSFWLFTKFGLSAAAIGAILIAAHALNIMSLALGTARRQTHRTPQHSRLYPSTLQT